MMKIVRFSTSALIFASVLLVIAARPAGAIPPDSYQQSCGQISEQGRILTASCRNRTGSPQGTALADFKQCVGDIANDDGTLRCSRGIALPRGDYEASCEQVVIDGDDLRATCRTAAGYKAFTKLSGYRLCHGGIASVDGALVCRSSSFPHGSFERSCAVTQVADSGFAAICRTRDGGHLSTTLANAAACHGDIANDDGRLVCRPSPELRAAIGQ